MTQHRPLNYGDPIPDSFLDALQELISTYVSPNLVISITAPTQISIAAGSDVRQVGVAVQGRWRWNTGPVLASHPGGAAGLYDIFVTASDNSFTPGTPEEIDHTLYSFGVQIVPSGSTPTTALARKIGQLHWTGAAIDALDSLGAGNKVGAPANPSIGQALVWDGTEWVAGLPTVQHSPYVTALPGTPADGDECYFVADATKGIVWHLRYNAAAHTAGKPPWEFLGGPPLLSYGGNVTLNFNGSVVIGSITLPVRGEFLAAIATTVTMTLPPPHQFQSAGISIFQDNGGLAYVNHSRWDLVDQGSYVIITGEYPTSPGGGGGGPVPAGTVFTHRLYSNMATGPYVFDLYNNASMLKLTPIRVGT